MKTKPFILLLAALTLSIFTGVQAQVFQISFNDHFTGVIGEFAKDDIKNPNAGYVYMADGGNLEFKFYIKKFGIGLRGSVTNYQRDVEAYKSDLMGKLGITENNSYSTLTRSYWSIGGDLGVSYVININEKFLVEPYFYFGFRTLSTPLDEVVYFENSTLYTYRNNPVLIYGISYIPGLKFQWNATKRLGLNLYLEYEGAGAYKETRKSVLYSNNSFERSKTDVSYKPQSINVGLGLAFSFGKTAEEK